MYEVELTNDEKDVILEILKNRDNPDIKYELISDRTQSTITILNDDSAELLSEYIKDYLISHGFDNDYRPNKIGITLERLIDKYLSVTGW